MSYHTIKGDFPLDSDGRPTKKKDIDSYYKKYLPVVYAEWDSFNKKANKNVSILWYYHYKTRHQGQFFFVAKL